MANVESKSPAAGHAQVKIGDRVLDTAGGHALVLGNSLAGYAETVSGRRVVFMIAVGNVPVPHSRSVQRRRRRPGSHGGGHPTGPLRAFPSSRRHRVLPALDLVGMRVERDSLQYLARLSLHRSGQVVDGGRVNWWGARAWPGLDPARGGRSRLRFGMGLPL